MRNYNFHEMYIARPHDSKYPPAPVIWSGSAGGADSSPILVGTYTVLWVVARFWPGLARVVRVVRVVLDFGRDWHG
jgi:hypothetical protein